MFQTKKKKIQTYLIEKSSKQFTPFDELLDDYLSGKMKERFSNLGTKKIDIHIDWLPDYRCITVQGIYNYNYLDLQIEPTEFSIGYDPVEPDDHIYYSLESKEQVYSIVKQVFEILIDLVLWYVYMYNYYHPIIFFTSTSFKKTPPFM